MSVQEQPGRAPLAGSLGRSGSHRLFSHGHGDDAGGEGGGEEFGELERDGDGGRSSSRRRITTTSPTGSGTRKGAPVMEWLGPRTVKAFRAAGLLNNERDDMEKNGSDRGEGGSIASAPTRRMRSSSSSLSLGGGRVPMMMMMRSTSEYLGGAPPSSRMGFASSVSEAGGGSVSPRAPYSHGGLMESPTYTVSSAGGSRERDTPRSASTAPTSVSSSSFAFREQREHEDIRDLRERHATETGALLSALSDSQRTTRMLRNENEDLRVRLESIEQMEMENEDLRRAVGELRREMDDLMRVQQTQSARTNGAGVGRSFMGTGTWTVPARRSGLSNAVFFDRDEDDVVGNGGIGAEEDVGVGSREPKLSFLGRNRVDQDHDSDEDDPLDISGMPLSSSTPAAVSKMHRRRFSNASSVLPVPPANMTMLLHDLDSDDNVSNGSSQSDFNASRAPTEVPASRRGYAHSQEPSISSTNHSIVTATSIASPRSIFLRPEHEMHLGDLQSLDWGLRGEEGNLTMLGDGW